MSFKCDHCQQPKQRPVKVVTERKVVDHLKTDIRRGPHGGTGSQIVIERTVCEDCLPAVVEAPIERSAPVTMSKKEIVPGVTVEGESLGDWAKSRISGSVGFCCSRSVPSDLPVVASSPSRSRRSSTI